MPKPDPYIKPDLLMIERGRLALKRQLQRSLLFVAALLAGLVVGFIWSPL